MERLTVAGVALTGARDRLRQFASYFGIGVIATLVDWAIFYLLIGVLGIFYVPALATSYGASTLLNFFLNRQFTFRNTSRQVHLQLALFGAIAVIGLGLNEGIIYSLVHLVPGGEIDVSLMVSRVIATVAVFAWNFMLNKRLTFHIFR
jgi:putative flippase GtrA